MRKAVFAAMIVLGLAFDAFGAEGIDGAFGFKLGQNFQPVTPLVKRAGKSGYTDVYEVKPDAPNPAFATYYVGVTPITHVVYEIIAVGKPVPGDAGEQMREAIHAFIHAKYDTEPGNPGSGHDIRQGKRVILFSGAQSGTSQNPGETTTDLLYIDTELNGRADEERRQIEAKQQAEHAQQLLKTFDGTGM